MKTEIVFGATSGIGKEISELLLKDGYRVAITGRRLGKLEALKKQYSNQVYVAQNDIQKVYELENVFNEIIKEFTTIDIIIQSSGVGHINPTLAWNKEEETIFTNVVGATKLYDLSFNLFRNQGFGHLVGITSIASIRGNRGAPAYFSSKAYQKAYLESLYMKTKTIKSNLVFITDIRPGFVDTAMALGNVFSGWFLLKKQQNKFIQQLRKRKELLTYLSDGG